jgi:hypothetical protein
LGDVADLEPDLEPARVVLGIVGSLDQLEPATIREPEAGEVLARMVFFHPEDITPEPAVSV